MYFRNLATRSRTAAALSLLLAVSAAAVALQNSSQSASGPLAVPAKQWATDASQYELKVLDYGHAYFRYRVRTQGARGDQGRDSIQSKDGTVARLVLRDGRAITPEEDAHEHERLQAMLDSPADFAKHVKGEATGRKTAADLIKLIPDAMHFTYAPGQPQRARHEAGEAPEIVLDYKSDPAWTAPTMTADALTGLQGRVWIDPQTHAMTRLEGTIFKGVNFGWFVAHIYPGGHFLFEQTRIGDKSWIVSHFEYDVEVRLMLKKMKEASNVEASGFASVPEMSYQDAVKMLLATPLPEK